MATPDSQVVDGFSLTNRWLLYTSIMLSPAQFISGIGSNIPTNIGFLAYNWYTQIQWYQAVQGHELHALSLLPVHFNLIYAITYMSGVSCGNLFIALILGAGTAGVLILNTVSAWASWSTNLPRGFGDYQFFFFGWRTLDERWHKFFLVWQIGDSVFTCASVLLVIHTAMKTVFMDDENVSAVIPWRGSSTSGISKYKYPVILVGAAIMLVGSWPLILWTELIMQRNHIESDTDMVAVWLFIAQVIAMILPSLDSAWAFVLCSLRRKE